MPPRSAGRRSAAAAPAAVALVLATLSAFASPVPAQEPEGLGEPAEVQRARRLAEVGSVETAIATLAAYLRERPDDATAHWLLGRYLYWAGRDTDAVEHYEAALARRPVDPWLRLEYAGMMLEMGAPARARTLVEPLTEEWTEGRFAVSAIARARALTLLGTAEYWAGDLSAASDRFREALALDPTDPDAGRQLREIRSLTRPWIDLGGALLDDNQPYRRYRASLEGGAYLTPLWTLAAGVVPHLLDAPPVPGVVGLSRTGAAAGWVEVSGSVPAARLRLRARLGGWWAGVEEEAEPMRGPRRGGSGDGRATAWSGSVEAALRLPYDVVIRARAYRDRYLATSASLDTLLMVRGVELRLDRSAASGWAGEGAASVESYPDGNVIRTAYAWLLAPVVSGLRLGYAFSWQDADETRWTLVDGATGGLVTRYVPYYTPEQVRTHSALGELTLGDDRLGVRLSGRYGLHAVEQAPEFLQPPDPPTGPSRPDEATLTFTARDFTPWEARATVTARPTEPLTLELGVAREETAFWVQDRIFLSARYRFPLPR